MSPMKNDKTTERQLQKMMVSEPRLFARLADRHLRAGEPKRAAKVLVKGLQQFPDSVAGWLVKGKLHLNLKQPKLARAAFEKAVAIDPEIPIAHKYSAELAQEEGDIDGYLSHLKALGALEPLDDNIQTMLQTAILRQTAVAKGVFTQHQVERMMPGSLRQALLRANALPLEIARRTERFAFPPESDPGKEQAAQSSVPPPETQPVWRDPKVKQQIAKMEEEEHDRLVRVSWAEAVNNPTRDPLVEIDDDGLVNDADKEEIDTNPLLEDVQTREPQQPAQPFSPPPPGLPSGMQKAMIKPYIPALKPTPKPADAVDLRESIQSKVIKSTDDWNETIAASSVLIPAEIATKTPKAVNLEAEWEGANPTPPKPSFSADDNTGMRNTAAGSIPLKRPRLTADIKLPPLRAIDAPDDADQFVKQTGTPAPNILRPVLQPSLEEPAALPDTQLIETPVEPFKKPRTDDQNPSRIEYPDIPIGQTIPSPVEKNEYTAPESQSPQPKFESKAYEESPAVISPLEVIAQEPVRIVRDDSPIQRLMQAKREVPPPEIQPVQPAVPMEPVTVPAMPLRPAPPVAPSTPLRRSNPAITRFEIPEIDEDPPPPVKRPTEFKPVEAPSTMVVPPPPPYSPAPQPALSPLKPKIALTTPRTTPLPPPPKVNERLEIVEEVSEPSLIPLPVDLPPPPPPPDLAAREEAVRQKLAAIVEEVTGKAPEPETNKPEPPAEEKQSDYHLKGKIATKTLAELYASQGDWARSAEVYEALLEKFPTNEAYRKRLESLKAKISEG